ncbi:universal stress protein [Acaryochloris sp. CCMEE 5410]|uniref:universal stress protein n=1 Tax=Acaryochloris sp. CCMEE 5410 TaxID=310037 RepID=UPI000248462B|nr:universal stress protein [Acaryochloris sp. CCMEE 5410]KAI9129676.1 universal stress protein [Acaryochloris sp. CCMEE 5410]
MRYHRILVALDTSFLQPAVYEQALVEAKLHAAEVKLFHSVEAEINPLGNSTISPVGTPLESGYLSPSAVDYELARQAWDAQIAESKLWLQEFCLKAEHQGIKTIFETELGNPGPQICERAKDWHADLIVVGRHGRTGLKELFLGSVSNHIVHHAPCSVLVIQGETVVSEDSI